MSDPLAEGALFAGRYRIVRLIAQGGMGAVYEVTHTETNRRRALKVMHPHIFESDEMRERFKHEARVAADIESDHIVDVSDAGIDDVSRTPFMVMELLRGEELGKRIKRIGPLPVGEVLTYLRQTAIALDKTHAAFIVHRDLKPDNLFLTHSDDGSPRIKILDFGVAKVVAEGATGHGTQSLGTPLYMAPEQFHPGARVTPAVDMFALALVAYTLLVGDSYWRAESTTAGGLIPFITVALHGPKHSAVERAAALGVTLPRDFDAWFFRATAFKPEGRFARASEAVAALEKLFASLSESALLIPAPRVRPTATSVPVWALTPGTFVPTATPMDAQALERPYREVAPRSVRRSRMPMIAGGTMLALLGLSVVAWNLVRNSETAAPAVSPAVTSAPASNASAANPKEARPEPVVEMSAIPVVDPPQPPIETAVRVDNKPSNDKPIPKPLATIVPVKSPSPTTKKPNKNNLLGQD